MAIRLGMLGMWHTHADGIVRQVAAHPDEFELVGFYDPDPEIVSSKRAAWEPLIPNLKVYDSPDEVLREKLDGVVVESRVYENLSLAKLALDSGRPVMLEKPAGNNLEEHQQLIDLAQRKHLHVQMIYLFRYMSAVQEMFTQVRAGKLGDVYEFRARLPKDLDSYDRFVEELGRYPGGIFFEMAGHVIDMMVAMLGPPTSVHSFMGHHYTKGPVSYTDNGLAVFGFPHAWGIIEVPGLEVCPHSRRIEVYGTKGALAIPHLGSGHLANKNIQTVERYESPAADWQVKELEAQTLQIRDLREFAAVISGKKEPDFTPEHDLAVQKALLQASGMEKIG